MNEAIEQGKTVTTFKVLGIQVNLLDSPLVHRGQ